MQKISAAVFRDDSLTPSIEELELAGPGPGEVLVRLVATGVCHTDLKVAGPSGMSPRPVVLGHEGSGVVAKIGTGIDDLEVGDHVVMTFDSCGHCPSCLEAEPAVCYNVNSFSCTRPDGSHYLTSKDGPVHGDFFNQSSFATYAIGKRRGVIKVRKDAPLEMLGPLGCGIQTGAGAVLNIFKLKPGQTLVVYGAGSLGLSAVMAAKIAGAGKIIAVDLHPSRLQLAAELGADEVITGDQERSANDQIRKILPDGVDFSLDTTSVASVMLDGIDILTPRGTFGFVTAPSNGKDLPIPMRSLMKGCKIAGISEGNSNPEVFIPQLIEFYMQGKFPFDRLIKFYPFEEIAQTFHDSENGVAIKPVLRFDQ